MANITVPIQVNLPDDWIEQIVNRLRNDPEFECAEMIRELSSAQTDTTLLAQKIWTKVCLITDPEDANIQHEVIHYGDLKQVFLEVLGWEI